jgi:hypothetical protein
MFVQMFTYTSFVNHKDTLLFFLNNNHAFIFCYKMKRRKKKHFELFLKSLHMFTETI